MYVDYTIVGRAKQSSSERVSKDASHFARVASLIISHEGKWPEDGHVFDLTLTLTFNYKNHLTSHQVPKLLQDGTVLLKQCTSIPGVIRKQNRFSETIVMHKKRTCSQAERLFSSILYNPRGHMSETFKPENATKRQFFLVFSVSHTHQIQTCLTSRTSPAANFASLPCSRHLLHYPRN
jgi:hypothetical protein